MQGLQQSFCVSMCVHVSVTFLVFKNSVVFESLCELGGQFKSSLFENGLVFKRGEEALRDQTWS